MRFVAALFLTLTTAAWSTVLYAYVEDRQRRTRRACIVANAALRRRIDRELNDLRVLVLDHLGITDDDATVTQPRVPDEPPTAPMELGDEIEADARAYIVRENTVADEPPTRSADWVEEAMKQFNFSGRDR